MSSGKKERRRVYRKFLKIETEEHKNEEREKKANLTNLGSIAFTNRN